MNWIEFPHRKKTVLILKREKKIEDGRVVLGDEEYKEAQAIRYHPVKAEIENEVVSAQMRKSVETTGYLIMDETLDLNKAEVKLKDGDAIYRIISVRNYEIIPHCQVLAVR